VRLLVLTMATIPRWALYIAPQQVLSSSSRRTRKDGGLPKRKAHRDAREGVWRASPGKGKGEIKPRSPFQGAQTNSGYKGKDGRESLSPAVIRFIEDKKGVIYQKNRPRL